MVLDLTRRSVTAGLGGVVSRVVAGPVTGGCPVYEATVARAEIEDAYERLLSEYVRLEEASIAAGRTAGGWGVDLRWAAA
jgi:hypothetical protein